ncbi:hypothetical protein LJ740_08785 [Planctobacterium marinum]|nr:hypothetical protein [Planctobacterium marinum]
MKAVSGVQSAVLLVAFVVSALI